MAFTLANWACISSSLNQGQETVTPYGGSATVLNAPNVFVYGSPTDSLATISAANYFLPIYLNLVKGDWILANGTDTSNELVVLTSSSTGVTVSSLTLLAAAKAELAAKEKADEEAKKKAQNQEGKMDANKEGKKELEVDLNALQWNGMSQHPVLLVPAPGEKKMIVVEHVELDMKHGKSPFAGGGKVGLEYGNKPLLEGVAASSTALAKEFEGSKDAVVKLSHAPAASLKDPSVLNAAVYLSNAGGPFTGGDSKLKVLVSYSVHDAPK